MIKYQENFTKPTESVTQESFNETVDSVVNHQKIITIRKARQEAALLMDSVKPNKDVVIPEPRVKDSPEFLKWRMTEDGSIKKRNKERGAGAKTQEQLVSERPEAEQLTMYADYVKRSLPGFIFVASHFDETENEVSVWVNGAKVKKKVLAAWRKQSAAHLNGQAVLDADHLGFDIREWFAKFSTEQLHELGILFVFITSSNAGVKVVFKARLEWGDLMENCLKMGELLGLPVDTSGKDASRMSFAPSRMAGDILYLDLDELLKYENPEFEARFGEAYRHQGSQTSSSLPRYTATSTNSDVQMFSTGEGLGQYHGVDIQKIVDALLGGKTPEPGTRHKTSLVLADMLRYITDSNAAQIEAILRAQPWVQDIIKERNENVSQTVKSAMGYREEKHMPKKLRKALAKAGVDSIPGIRSRKLPYGQWAKDLNRLALGCYIPAIAHIEIPQIQPGGIITSGVMYDTCLTRCYYRNWEGKTTRINSKALVIGPPTSGKGFAVQQDEAIMELIREQDQQSRQEEREYKEALKERATSTKEQGKDALKRPEGIIRYLPVKTSNAILYRRMQNAMETMPDGEPFYLHVYMFSSELLTFVTATGNFQEKRDILLQSHSNERNGVDYANADSINDTLPMHFNCVFTGTQTSLQRMVNARNVGDGLSTRFCCFVMPTGDFKMRPFRKKPSDQTPEQEMKQWSQRFCSLSGEIKGLERLTRHVYDIVAAKAEEADHQKDRVTLTFCMRMQDKLMALCIPEVISTQKSWDEFEKTHTVQVTRRHLAFADYMFDVLLQSEDQLFGQLWQDMFDLEDADAQTRVVTDRTAEFFSNLPDEFTTTDVMNTWGYTSNTTASTRINSFLANKQVEKVSHGHYRKLVSSI